MTIKLITFVMSALVFFACGGGGDDPVPPVDTPKSWQTAQLLENTEGDVRNNPDVKFGVDGNAIAVWSQSNSGGFDEIYVAHYDAGTLSWSLPLKRSNDDTVNATNPKVAIDRFGNAIIAWSQYDGVTDNIYTSYYDNETGLLWALPVEIDNEAGRANFPEIAFDPEGNAVVVWEQYDGLNYSIYANRFNYAERFDITNGWGTAELIEDNDLGNAHFAKVVLDMDGNAIAVWEQSGATNINIVSNRHEKSSGMWGDTVELLESINTGNASEPQIDIDANGNVFAVWLQKTDGTTKNIYANRYDVINGWGIEEPIDVDIVNENIPKLAVDASGNSYAIWERQNDIYMSYYDINAGGPWSVPTLVSNFDPIFGGVFDPDIAFAENGNPVAIWQQYNGQRDAIYASHFDTVTNAWDEAVLVDEAITNDGNDYAQITVDSNGNAVVTWINDDVYSDIWVNHYR